MDKEKIKQLNLAAIFRRHGVDNLDQYEERFKTNRLDWEAVEDEIETEIWINRNMIKRGKTIREYLRALVEAKIRD